MRQHLFPRWLWSRFSEQWSYHTGSWPGTLEVRQTQLAKEILNDSCVTMSFPILSPISRTPNHGLPCHWASSRPFLLPYFFTQWPAFCTAPGPWFGPYSQGLGIHCSEVLITQTSCADFKHTQTLGPALMQSGNNTKHTNPSLKHASNILINPPSLPYVEETLLGSLLLYFQDEAASRPQKCSLHSL